MTQTSLATRAGSATSSSYAKNASRRSTAASVPPMRSNRPGTSWGTSHWYCTAVPSWNPSECAGSASPTKKPSALRARKLSVRGSNTLR
ncbi:Uncharacterised protein [Mycobacteroides abscessus]|nr:Uncharacterised protein [Mycobacteroides abscessus]